MTERLNVRRMQMPEQEARQFDIREELTEKDWETLKTYVEIIYRRSPQFAARLALYGKVLNPNKTLLTEDQRVELEQDTMRPTNRTKFQAIIIAAMRFLRPSAKVPDPSDISLAREAFENYRAGLRTDLKAGLLGAFTLALLDSEGPHFSADETQFIDERINLYIKAEERSWQMTETLALARLVGFRIPLSAENQREIFESTQKQIRAWRANDSSVDQVFITAFAQYVLSADEARVGPKKGIELVFRDAKSTSSSSPPQPEVLEI